MATFYIDQHGCAKNQTDSELICSFLQKEGFVFSETPEKADFIIINSCGFIESAKKESINAVYNIRAAYPDARIILAGCLAQRYAQELHDSMPELDGIFGNGDLSKIASYIKQVKKGKREPAIYPQTGICQGERTRLLNYKASAYVKITEGCSNHCSFCAIPLIRGPVRSRSVDSIVSEMKSLVAQGVYELNLIGQDLAAFETENPGKKSSLAVLLAAISKLKGDFIIRTLYIHPDHFNTDILEIFKKDRRFVPYFDIPFQSGDDDIIVAMNRKGTARAYTALVKKIREELPQTVLRTTFLTGFPGETEEAAQNTRDFLKKIAPCWSGCFAFSREEDTPAWNLKNRVPAKLAKERAEQLQAIQSELTAKQLKKFTGTEQRVLVEEIMPALSNTAQDEAEGLAIGRAWFQAPDVDGCVVIRYDIDDKKQCKSIKPGNVVKVKILACTGIDLDSRYISLEKECKACDISYSVI